MLGRPLSFGPVLGGAPPRVVGTLDGWWLEGGADGTLWTWRLIQGGREWHRGSFPPWQAPAGVDCRADDGRWYLGPFAAGRACPAPWPRAGARLELRSGEGPVQRGHVTWVIPDPPSVRVRVGGTAEAPQLLADVHLPVEAALEAVGWKRSAGSPASRPVHAVLAAGDSKVRLALPDDVARVELRLVGDDGRWRRWRVEGPWVPGAVPVLTPEPDPGTTAREARAAMREAERWTRR